MTTLLRSTVGTIITTLVIAAATQADSQQLNNTDLLKPPTDTWPTYFGDYSGRRYSSLTQINTSNANMLSLAWAFQTNQTQWPLKSTPLLVGGILYFTIPDRVWAVDARTGRQIWTYSYKDQGSSFYIGHRGVGMYKDLLYFLTNDAHLICLNARDGSIRWKIEVADAKVGFFATMAPQIIGKHVIVGASGDFYDLNGFIRSYDAETGEPQWQWNVIPKPGEPGSETWPAKGDALQHGGGMTWMSGTYDPDLNLIYWGLGNPNPTMYGGDRPGSNLYTCSIVALDPDTGKLKWHFQASPHDVHDWDATEAPVLVDGDFHGKPRKLLMQASRNGYFFVLDRTTGESLLSTPFIDLNWSLGTTKQGEPIGNPTKEPTAAGTFVMPGSSGAANWPPPSFSPKTGLFYVNATQSYSLFYHLAQGKAVGYAGKDFNLYQKSSLKALDYQTGQERWSYNLGDGSSLVGILTSAGDILFTADTNGNLLLLDARTGKDLWHANVGGTFSGSPITYQLDGRQYILVGVQGVLFAWALPEALMATGNK